MPHTPESPPAHAVCPFSGENLGAAYNPFAQDQADNPYPILSVARAQQPVFHAESLGVWVVTSYQLVRDVLLDSQTYLSSGVEQLREHPPEVANIIREIPQYIPMLTMVDAPKHTHRRNLTRSGFSASRIRKIEPSIRELANKLIDDFYAKGECEFYDSFSFRFPLLVVSRLMGLPDSMADKVHFWAACRMGLAWGDKDLDTYKAFARGAVDFQSYIESEVRRRKHAPQDDFISDMLHQNRNTQNPISFAELVEEVQGVVAGGHETVASWVTVTLHHLLSHRNRWERIVADKSLIPALLEESLRFQGPVNGIWRRTARDVVLGDKAIPADSLIYVSLASANRDEAMFAAADQFDETRGATREHIMFGRGPHTCVGFALARVEGRIAFEVLAERLPSLRLRQGDISFEPNLILRQPRHLFVEWERDNGSAPAGTREQDM